MSNPYRLAIRLRYPDFFHRYNKLIINGEEYSAYGNIQLLHNPFKEQVVVHRSYSSTTFNQYKNIWLHTAANGGVLVSPFISQREKEIRREAELCGGRFILITEHPFGQREKPSGHDFELCSSGRMLMIAPTAAISFGRAACLRMNSIAKTVADIDDLM